VPLKKIQLPPFSKLLPLKIILFAAKINTYAAKKSIFAAKNFPRSIL